MPVLEKSIQFVGKSLPKVISPTVHAVADYTTAAVFLGAGVLFWKKSKRAAIPSVLCGAAEAAVAAFTDYPGGIKNVISFPLHRKIDFGFSGMVATMPEFLAFEEEREKGFFRAQAVLISGITAATNFEPQQIAGEREAKAA